MMIAKGLGHGPGTSLVHPMVTPPSLIPNGYVEDRRSTGSRQLVNGELLILLEWLTKHDQTMHIIRLLIMWIHIVLNILMIR